METTKGLDNYSRKQIINELLLYVNSKEKPTHGVIFKKNTKSITRQYQEYGHMLSNNNKKVLQLM